MSAETLLLVAAGYVAVVIVALAMFAAAGRADRETARTAEDEHEPPIRTDDAPARDRPGRFRRRRTPRVVVHAGSRGRPPDDQDRSPADGPTR